MSTPCACPATGGMPRSKGLRVGLWACALRALAKLDPRLQWRNPVMFVVYAASLLTTLLALGGLTGNGTAFITSVALCLWFTVLVASLAEALAESHGEAPAVSSSERGGSVQARRLSDPQDPTRQASVAASELRCGEVVRVETGDVIPGDGEVIQGAALVDESAITGESAPVIRATSAELSRVTGGTRVLCDCLVVRISANPGESFIERRAALAAGARRHRTLGGRVLWLPLLILTGGLLAAALAPCCRHSVAAAPGGSVFLTLTTLLALCVCLIPTTLGGLLSVNAAAGMSRVLRANVIAVSGRAVEAAGRADVLLLDKTARLTLGDRRAARFLPAPGVSEVQLADAAQLASLADETPEGRSIVVLAKQRFGLRARPVSTLGATFVPFCAATGMSGVDLGARQIRKGAAEAIQHHVEAAGQVFPRSLLERVRKLRQSGSTPLLVSDGARVLGLIELTDSARGGIRERLGQLRRMGIKTVMISGDSPLTAAAIAAEAGVDDFLAEATPEAKLRLIMSHQARGHRVAMTGDGTHDAPVLARADVSVAMNAATRAFHGDGSMVDLDSNPTKLIDVVETGRQMLMTRGALATFGIASDVARCLAIIPAALAVNLPPLAALDVLHLASPASAILSAVIFNALIIVLLIPLALKGVRRPPAGSAAPGRHLVLYGLGGFAAPFAGIKLIDLLLSAAGWG
jgi:K+-transporting ATPase ATPase B chain